MDEATCGADGSWSVTSNVVCTSYDTYVPGSAYTPGDTICFPDSSSLNNQDCVFCGDAQTDVGEDCDDANSDPLDACNACSATVCGD